MSFSPPDTVAIWDGAMSAQTLLSPNRGKNACFIDGKNFATKTRYTATIFYDNCACQVQIEQHQRHSTVCPNNMTATIAVSSGDLLHAKHSEGHLVTFGMDPMHGRLPTTDPSTGGCPNGVRPHFIREYFNNKAQIVVEDKPYYGL